MRIGSCEHRALMCRFFIDTHLPYAVEAVEWPRLTETEHRFLANLPIWGEAVNTEYETALLVRAMAEHESDPMLAEAIGLQAFEEERHSRLVTALTDRYGFKVERRPPPHRRNPTFAFRQSGWGECIDSFVAFGVFGLIQEAEVVPKELVGLFDLIMQEEARHILFFENWRLYRRHRPGGQPGSDLAADLWAMAVCLGVRIRLAVSVPRGTSRRDENFLLGGARALEGITARSLVDASLSESARRLAPYESDLCRPLIVPRLARALRRALPDRLPPGTK